jgi:glycosyltransferase involved in cell wall biosynthesis
VIQDGVTGLIAPDGDPAALADRLASLLKDQSLRERLTTQGYDRVRQTYSLDASVDRFLSLFDAAIHHSAHN